MLPPSGEDRIDEPAIPVSPDSVVPEPNWKEAAVQLSLEEQRQRLEVEVSDSLFKSSPFSLFPLIDLLLQELQKDWVRLPKQSHKAVL